MPLQQLILMLLVLPIKLDVLLQELDVFLLWGHVLHIQEQIQLAHDILEMMEIALHHQVKPLQLLVLLKYAQMHPIQQQLILHVNHFHTNVSPTEQDA